MKFIVILESDKIDVESVVDMITIVVRRAIVTLWIPVLMNRVAIVAIGWPHLHISHHCEFCVARFPHGRNPVPVYTMTMHTRSAVKNDEVISEHSETAIVTLLLR